MIASLSGKLTKKAEKEVIVETGGIGWRVFVSEETLRKLPQAGEAVKLWTHLYLRQDGDAELYGFLSEEELAFFEMLNSVAGIGPKSALGVLGVAPLEKVKAAIASGDATLLTRVSGVGKKSAARIILELKSKVIASEKSQMVLGADLDAEEALTALGYTHSQARAALEKVPPDITSPEDRVREALRILGRK